VIGETPAAVLISERPAAAILGEAPPAIAETPTAPASFLPTASQEDAGRYASQLVSEINRYKQPAAATSAPDHSLRERLAGEIEGSHSLDAVPAPSASSALGMFDEALGKMLSGDAGGPSKPEAGAVRPLSIVQS
jgi:hypothetical protein